MILSFFKLFFNDKQISNWRMEKRRKVVFYYRSFELIKKILIR
jgi:hypothetical protein